MKYKNLYRSADFFAVFKKINWFTDDIFLTVSS